MKMVPLGEVAYINPPAQKLESTTTIDFVGMAELSEGLAAATPRASAKFGDYAKGYTQFKKGDILAAKITPCWENGKVGIANLNNEFGMGSTEFHVIRPSGALDERYLLHFLRQEHVRSTGTLRMAGSGGQRRVPKKYLTDVKVPLPPLDEQRRIAAILDKADAIRQKRRRAIAHLDTLTQSIFHDMFGGLKADATLAEVATVQGGLQVSSKRASNPIEVQYLRVANAHRGFLDLGDVKSLKATQSEIDRTKLHPLDLLFVEGHANPQEVGRASIWNNEIDLCVHQNHLIRARLDQSKVHPQFALAWFNSREGAQHFARAARTTSGLNTISTTTVKTAPILTASLEDQAEFCKRSRRVTQEHTSRKSALLKAELLNPSLQSRAFRGEL